MPYSTNPSLSNALDLNNVSDITGLQIGNGQTSVSSPPGFDYVDIYRVFGDSIPPGYSLTVDHGSSLPTSPFVFATATPTPEPSGLVLFGIAAGGAGSGRSSSQVAKEPQLEFVATGPLKARWIMVKRLAIAKRHSGRCRRRFVTAP